MINEPQQWALALKRLRQAQYDLECGLGYLRNVVVPEGQLLDEVQLLSRCLDHVIGHVESEVVPR